MINVIRMENDRRHGPFAAMPNPEEMAKHVPWLKVFPTDHGIGVGPKTTADRITHPHHMLDIPGADIGGDMMGAIMEMIGSPWKVGVKDKDQFLHWFPKTSLDWFASQGFRADTYAVPERDVKFGKYQLMFDASKAKLVNEQPLTELE